MFKVAEKKGTKFMENIYEDEISWEKGESVGMIGQ